MITPEMVSGVTVVLLTTALGLIGWTSRNLYEVNRELGTVIRKTQTNSEDISQLEDRVYEYLYDKRDTEENQEV